MSDRELLAGTEPDCRACGNTGSLGEDGVCGCPAGDVDTHNLTDLPQPTKAGIIDEDTFPCSGCGAPLPKQGYPFTVCDECWDITYPPGPPVPPNDVPGLIAERDALMADLAAARTRIAELDEECDALGDRLTERDAELDAMEDDCTAEVQRNVAAIAAENQTFAAELDAVKAENKFLRDEIDRLRRIYGEG